MCKQLRFTIIITTFIIFFVNNVSAGFLISQEEMYGNSEISKGGGDAIGAIGIIMILILTFFPTVSIFIFMKIKEGRIEKEHAQNFKKQINELMNNRETQELAKKIKNYNYTDLILESKENFIFYVLEDAKKKAEEIIKNGCVAFIWESSSEYSGGITEVYTVFKLEHESRK